MDSNPNTSCKAASGIEPLNLNTKPRTLDELCLRLRSTMENNGYPPLKPGPLSNPYGKGKDHLSDLRARLKRAEKRMWRQYWSWRSRPKRMRASSQYPEDEKGGQA